MSRDAFALAILALAAGCAAPDESGPADLDRGEDTDALPDDRERNATKATGDQTLPGLDLPGVPDMKPV